MLVKMVALCSLMRLLLFGCIFPITSCGGLSGREMQGVALVLMSEREWVISYDC